MRQPDEFEQAMREIRARKFRRMFDPFIVLEDGVDEERPLSFYRFHVRKIIEQKHEFEAGKRPHSAAPTWSLPVGSGRGRPVSATGVRVPHTRNRVGGHSSSQGAIAAVGADRYHRRQEKQPELDKVEAIAATVGDEYLNRLEQEAIAGGAPVALRTNMKVDPVEREREWIARTRHERKAGLPRININADRDPALCQTIADDPRWPEGLRIAITRDHARVREGGSRAKSKKAGEPWIDAAASTVFADLCAVYQLRPADAGNAITYGKPRAGRVFYKWEAELPRELDERGRQAYLDRLASELDARGISFVLVMHRPEPVNDPSNYHVHLLYSDRPVARLPDGSYDIEQVSERDYGRGRRREVHQRQPKVRLVSEREWTMSLRGLHVDCCNHELERLGARGRYTAGGFEAAGIAEGDRQKKLGAAAARFEAAGVGTANGVENALIDWDRIDRRRGDKHERRLARLRTVHKARATADPAGSEPWDRWLAASVFAENARAAAEEVADAIEMATSRTRASMAKTAVIADAAPSGSWEASRWQARRAVAAAAHADIEGDLGRERAVLSRAEAERQRAVTIRDGLRQHLRALAPPTERTARSEPVAATAMTPLTAAHRFIDRHESRGIEIEKHTNRYLYPSEHIQRACGVASAFDHPALQARLAKLHSRQRDEIGRVSQLVQRRGALSSDSDTPFLKALVDRWRDHEEVRRALRLGRSRQFAWEELQRARDEDDAWPVASLGVRSRPPEVSDLLTPSQVVASGAASLIVLAPIRSVPNDAQADHQVSPDAKQPAFDAGGRPTPELKLLILRIAREPSLVTVVGPGKIAAGDLADPETVARIEGWRQDLRVTELIADLIHRRSSGASPV